MTNITIKQLLGSRFGWANRGHLRLLLLLTTISVLFILAVARASDHGDGHIGDLYVFESRGKLVLITTIAATIPENYTQFRFSQEFVYRFLIDRDTLVTYDNKENNRKYGATIIKPESIKEDVVIDVWFPDENGNPRISTTGLNLGKDTAVSLVLLYTGVRDEPFIRRGLEGKNIAAIVIEIPIQEVSPNKEGPLLVWSTTIDKKGNMEDLGAHPYSSQIKGNEKLNSTHPSQHTKLPGVLAPDVIIYDFGRPAGYPNGRLLTDDVVNLLNLQDKLPNEQPSPDKNDLEFLSDFPYLAPPHNPAHALFEKQAPTIPVGMNRRELGRLDLGRELRGMGNRDARLRFWLMEPGGTIPFHKHRERPAIVYLLTGEIDEYKWDEKTSRAIVSKIKAGQATREAADTEHYWLNKSNEAVLMAAVDLVDALSEGLTAPAPQPLPQKEWDVSSSYEQAKRDGLVSAEYDLLQEIPVRETIPQVSDAYNYVMRGRHITVKPGEMIPLQHHRGRPTIAYVIQGTIAEYRDDLRDTTVLRGGDFTINSNGVSRWLKNATDSNVRIFEVDFHDSHIKPSEISRKP